MNTYKTLTIIGLGLIGSSVARAVKKQGLAKNIIGYDSNPLTLQLGLQEGFITKAAETLEEAVKKSELIIIAAPPSVSLDIIAELGDLLSGNVLVTDVASVKSCIAKAMNEHLAGKAVYVPSHPIAGSEKTGASAGKADLFAGKRVIMTPETPEDAGIEEISVFWREIGAEVEYMPPDVHDSVYAYVSHLPQMLAFAYKPYAEKLEGKKNLPEHFARFTRLCHSDPYLWEDIFFHNKEPLDMAMARFLVILSHIRDELAENEEIKEKQKDIDLHIWAHWLPRLVASCLVATMVQQSRDYGFNFNRFAGSGFKDFTAPLTSEPEVDMEAISQHASEVVSAVDQLIASLSQVVVTKD